MYLTFDIMGKEPPLPTCKDEEHSNGQVRWGGQFGVKQRVGGWGDKPGAFLSHGCAALPDASATEGARTVRFANYKSWIRNFILFECPNKDQE